MSVKLFTLPVSNISGKSNYNRCVINGVSTKYMSKYKTWRDSFKLLEYEDLVYLWGVEDHSKSVFEKLEKGNMLLFYFKGNIISASEVIGKFIDENIARDLWSEELKEKTQHPNVILLKKAKSLKLPYSILASYAKYRPKATVRRFYEYNKIGVENIISEFGCIDNFIKHFELQTK